MKLFFFNFKIKTINKCLVNYVKNIFYIKKFYLLFKKQGYITHNIYQRAVKMFLTSNKFNNYNFYLFWFPLFFFKLKTFFINFWNIKVLHNNMLINIYVNYFKYLTVLNYFYINKLIFTNLFITTFYSYVCKNKDINFNTKIILILNIYNKIFKFFKIKLKYLNVFFYNLNIFYLPEKINYNINNIKLFSTNLKSSIKYNYKEINLFFFKNKLNRILWKQNKIRKHFIFYLQNINEFNLFNKFSKKKQSLFFFYKFFLNNFIKKYNYNLQYKFIQNLYLLFNALKKNLKNSKKKNLKNNNSFININSCLCKLFNITQKNWIYFLTIRKIKTSKFVYFLRTLNFLKHNNTLNNNLYLINFNSKHLNIFLMNFWFKKNILINKINKIYYIIKNYKYMFKFKHILNNLNFKFLKTVYFILKSKNKIKKIYKNFFKWKLNYFYLNSFLQNISFTIIIRSTIHNLWISISSTITGSCLYQKSSGNFGFKHKNKTDYKVPIIMCKYYLKNFFKEKVKKKNYNLIYYNILLKGTRHNLILRNQILRLLKESMFIFLGFFESPLISHNGCLLKRKARKQKQGLKKKKIKKHKKIFFKNLNKNYLINRINIFNKF